MANLCMLRVGASVYTDNKAFNFSSFLQRTIFQYEDVELEFSYIFRFGSFVRLLNSPPVPLKVYRRVEKT